MRRSRARQILWVIAGLIAAGMATTVVVCWVISATYPDRQNWANTGKSPTVEFVYWSASELSQPTYTGNLLPPVWSALANPGEPERILAGIPKTNAPHGPQVIEIASGWPMLAMRARMHDAEWQTTPVSGPRYSRIDGIQLATRWTGGAAQVSQPRALPLHPLWPGFIINSGMFAAAWSLPVFLVWGVRAIARRFRRRQGECPRCGYDLFGQTQPGCPECGWRRAAAQPTDAKTPSLTNS